MPDYNEMIHTSAQVEAEELAAREVKKKTFADYFALAVTTFGVGYLPLMPGTYGSIAGVLIYLIVGLVETNLGIFLLQKRWSLEQITAWTHAINLVVFFLFCLLGIWAATRAVKLFQNKDPKQAVVDEVIGQIIVFLFVPFGVDWKFVLAGFVLFRIFDIWKPYPIDSLQNLPAGIGVCADDILAGVYAGTCLAIVYAAAVSFG
jgi:phosphatidylglycerophosphatase A